MNARVWVVPRCTAAVWLQVQLWQGLGKFLTPVPKYFDLSWLSLTNDILKVKSCLHFRIWSLQKNVVCGDRATCSTGHLYGGRQQIQFNTTFCVFTHRPQTMASYLEKGIMSRCTLRSFAVLCYFLSYGFFPVTVGETEIKQSGNGIFQVILVFFIIL